MLSFQYPVLLWGLLGLAVPVLLHLMHRELFRLQRFPSVRFILREKLPLQRKKVPRDLLLLALRLLLLAALIFALARPEWESRAAAGDERAERIVFLVDVSASMGGWHSLEEAAEHVSEVLDRHAGAEAGVVLSSDRVVDVLAPTENRGLVLERVEEAVPETVAGNHSAGLREALALLGEGADRTLYVVSDLQATSWERGRLPEVSSDVRLEWLRTGTDRGNNTAVLRVRAYPREDDRRYVLAELQNFGGEEVVVRAALSVGGERWEQDVTLPPGRVTEIGFDIGSPEASRGRLSLSEDPFEADNHYHFWLGRPPPLHVGVSAPLNREPAAAEPLFFLQRALDARGDEIWMEFETRTFEPQDLGNDWSDYRAVFLLGALQYFEEEQWEALEHYLEGGGLVVASPGAASPGREMGILRERGLLEAEYLGAARADRRGPSMLSPDWIHPESPIGRLFIEEAAESLYRITFYRYLRLQLEEDDRTQVWLRSSEEEPLLVRRQIGQGSFLFFTFPFSTQWSELPLTGAFLPLMRELVAGDLSEDHGVVREETGFSLSGAAARLGVSPEDPVWDGIDTRRPGVYEVRGTPLEVNLSRRESVLETASAIDLARSMRPRDETDLAGGGATARDAGDRARPLWPWFAAAAGLFFLVEMLAAAFAGAPPAYGGKGISAPGLTTAPQTATDKART